MNFTDKQRAAFWAKVAVSGPDQCWRWTGCTDTLGYGRFSMKRHDGAFTKALAHRIAAFLAGSRIDDVLVCHRCDNPPCCNPKHLFTGTQLENMRDMAEKGRANVLRGEKNPRARLTERDVLEILAMIESGLSLYSIAKAYGVGWTTLAHIRDGHNWRHVKPDSFGPTSK